MTEYITNQEFFETLSSFYELTREKGSVWITLKRSKFNKLFVQHKLFMDNITS